jgi:ubiquinone/menaquinone biosynthesis C-methylase UbiE
MSDLAAFQHPRFARMYQRISATADRRGAAEHRARLLAGLTGRVLEVGAGNGRNFAHYPTTVTGVLAVEPDDELRAAAERAAADAPVPVTVVAGHADELPAGSASFDAAVTSLVLCSVPDQGHALAELLRVLRPGAELRFYEHVRSHHKPFGLVEDLVTPLWARVGGGCHLNRDTAQQIRDAGFLIEAIERLAFRPTPLVPPTAHILGRARKPGSAAEAHRAP